MQFLLNRFSILPSQLPAAIFFFVFTCVFANAHAQNNLPSLNKVLTLTGGKQGAKDIPQDHGTAGIWQRLLKLQSTGSALHTQAHPDDEHADLLTYLGRGKGVRTALLSLNRGESGGNVLGVEFFDPLGLLRTEEFLLASSYYGLDDLYFTRLVDYGFSKNVAEAYEKWGKENVIAEMVRVIRINRPLVIISRFHGTPRDGHGNHQAAGEISQLAFTLAADPTAFPEQILKEGLRPWQALKLYRGGIKENEHWNIKLNTGEQSPWLGESYKNFASRGYSLHRSQHGGTRNESHVAFHQYYERLQSKVTSSEKEYSFFEGIDTTITGIFSITGEKTPDAIIPLLQGISADVKQALSFFQLQQPAAIIPTLVAGLHKTRAAIRLLTNQTDARFLLEIKEIQFMDAINTVMGIHLEGIAVPPGTKTVRSFFAPQPAMGFAVAERPFKVEVTLVNKSIAPLSIDKVELIAPPKWEITPIQQSPPPVVSGTIQHSFTVVVPESAGFSIPYFHRNSLNENQYQITETAFLNLPWSAPELMATASYTVNDELITLRVPVQVRRANTPYGYDKYTLKVAPAIAVNVHPRTTVIPIGNQTPVILVNVELVNNADTLINGILDLKVPAGWNMQPEKIAFTFARAGEKNNFQIKVFPSTLTESSYAIAARAMVSGHSFTSGYNEIRYRDLDISFSSYPAAMTVKGINVISKQGIKIGYIMGVGDEIPASLQQLGAKVQLLTPTELATGKLSQYDVVMVGTRAYAVRQDLHMYNQRLMDYAKNGGHLIVLFQTPEYIPERMAPFLAKLPSNPEEVTEENSQVQILQPAHRVMNFPNKITSAEFDNWVEQRGSKFFSEWDPAYTAIISTHDKGQAPQSGGWLMANYGKGHFTYFAYAFHRQLPYMVTGAYKIMANLLAYGKQPVKTK